MLRFLPALFTLVFFSAGCGYVGDPMPPLANIPAAVTDLTAFQRSARIVVQFTLPSQTTEGIAIHSPLEVDLRAGTKAIQPFSPAVWEEGATKVPAGTIESGHARIEIPTRDLTGKEVTIGVRVIGSNGKESSWSNFVNLPVVPPPAMPSGVEAKATAEGVLLTWQGGQGEFRVFRRAGKDADFSRVADVAQERWIDRNSQFGTFYSYVVQRIVKTGNDHDAESELTAPVVINPVDTFPPAPPAGLRAIPAPGSIELSWDGNAEPDLAGYRVYRFAPGGTWTRIGAADLPGYSDHSAEKGKTYRYAVSAVDRSGNESARSAEVASALPQ